MQLANNIRKTKKFKLCIDNRPMASEIFLPGGPVMMVLDGWVRGQIATMMKQKKKGGRIGGEVVGGRRGYSRIR